MNQRFLDQNYYEILEIQPSSAEHEIHRAYLKAKEAYSPDSPALYTMFSPEEAKELSRLIEEAYAILSNHAARREYDSRLFGRQTESPPKTDNSKLEKPSNSSRAATGSEVHPSHTTSARAAKTLTHQKGADFKVDEAFEREIANTKEFDGKFLERLRNYKKMSLDELSDKIRVSRPYIKAVESNDYKSLPADVFVRGFVAQYAKAMGLDSNLVANSYMKILKDARNK
jgi:cytoskeletal protein RodZ